MSDELETTSKLQNLQRATVVGRPKYTLNRNYSTLTPELVDKFSELVNQGLPETRVCESLGINYGKFADWMKTGEDYFNKHGAEKNFAYLEMVDGLDYSEEAKATWLGILAPGDKRTDPYLCCLLLIEKRRAFADFTNKVIQRSLNTDDFTGAWQRDIEILSRRDPEHWARNPQVERKQVDYDKDDTFL